MPREILTVQVGHFANHVATHFWNAHHERIASHAAALAAEAASGGDHAMPSSSPSSSSSSLSSSSLAQHTGVYEPSVFGQGAPAANPEAYWSDAMSFEYAPRSLYEIPEVRVNALTWEAYSDGAVFLDSSPAEREAIEDSLFRLAESCDSLQGLQFLANTNSGYGGMAAGLVQLASDILPKAPILMVATVPETELPTHPLKRRRAVELRGINDALALTATIDSGVALSLPFDVSKWLVPERSAVVAGKALGTALDAISLLYAGRSSSIGEVAHSLALTRMLRVAQVSSSAPLPDAVYTAARAYSDARPGTPQAAELLPLARLYEVELAAGLSGAGPADNPLGLSWLARSSPSNLGDHIEQKLLRTATSRAAEDDDDPADEAEADAPGRSDAAVADLFADVYRSAMAEAGEAGEPSEPPSTADQLEALVGRNTASARAFVELSRAAAPYAEAMILRTSHPRQLSVVHRYLSDSYLGYSPTARKWASAAVTGASDFTHLSLAGDQAEHIRALRSFVVGINTADHVAFLDADYGADDWQHTFAVLNDVADAYGNVPTMQ
ncbi:uncharacterized protein AMSG_05972 [Thecamonas trahens ATCC 50062]|uniref:Uncharacterized protein n=1 Tax=Thecamonas trahens ATCC 50062 TaxID=461836 RepID=A0A0L0DBJ4_THETB|nr:hypothetical protein AMSG_05972 [Thecamonas trahens ATCC 50062]KNC49707.1 hypothetical protein AMSG_05972 [Thecamonas trahens ATCC 50062]|eukprot:XP_013757500.1 hypothetical protein AMSG_05972 [Thecamonas trahens ATCC 50062]